MCIPPASGDKLQHGRIVPQHALGDANDPVHPRHAPTRKHVLQHLHEWPGKKWMCSFEGGTPFWGRGNQKETFNFEGPFILRHVRNKWSLLSVRVADTKKQPGPSAASMFSSASNMVALTRSLRMEAKSQGASQRGSTSTFSAPPWREKVANS